MRFRSLNVAVAAIVFAAVGTSVRAQNVVISTPINDQSLTNDSPFDVTGSINNVAAGTWDRVKVTMHEVDTQDNPVAGDDTDSGTDTDIPTSGTGAYQWSVSLHTPNLPPGSTKRYKITAELLNGTTHVDSFSIFVDLTVSGGPGGGG